MPSKLSFFCTIFISVITGGSAVNNTNCYTVTEFTNHCKKLNGTTDGGRCYFFGETPTTARNWSYAVAICKSFNAEIAQIHSEHEFKIIQAYVMQMTSQNTTGNLMTLALMDNETAGVSNSPVLSPTTVWLDQSDSSVRINVSSTWVRSHWNDTAGNTLQPRLLGLNPKKGYVILDYNIAKVEFTPFCQFTNLHQEYTYTNTCVAETPVLTIDGKGPADCADLCALRAWCRSFNFIDNATTGAGSNQCELFTWSVSDTSCSGTGCANKTTARPACHHFNFVYS